MAKGGITDSKDPDKHQTSLQKSQANTLIYPMREEANAILYSFGLNDSILYSFGLNNSILYAFGLNDGDKKKYNTILNKSEAHFVKCRNPIYE